MTVPFKVKALYEYRSSEPDDLNFENGQIITVTDDEDADWYTGEYASADGQKQEGLFPRNFVEKYEPAIPTRPTRAPRKAAPPEAVETQTTAKVPEPAPPPAAVPPAAHEPAKEAEIDPPREFVEPVPAPKAEAQPPASVVESKPAAKKAPPVVEKPSSSSFRDRIAAFNKPAAAPVTPFKPAATGGGVGFIKKPFVAPPPSRNAYVPPPRDLPAQKIPQREEEPETERVEAEPEARPQRAAPEEPAAEDDQPKPTSLKDRIALLQKQQLEQAQRHADHAKKKEKPKRPPKTRTDSSEMHSELPDESVPLERASVEAPRREEAVDDDITPSRTSIEEANAAPTPPMPSRELVSDTNDADDSGAADTEDAQETSTEEERVKPKSVKSPPPTARPEASAEAEEEEGTDTEEEEDPEVRRRRELRERMAKMSGGMGMMGMFGAGAAPGPRKTKAPREERPPESQTQEEIARAPPVPIMALPGMSNLKQMPRPAPGSEEEDESAQPTPTAAHDVEEDYLSQKPSRKSTERSMPLSPQDRAPPPLPPTDRPEPPQTPGARPVPPPPPPTKTPGELPLARDMDEPDDEDDGILSPPPNARPLSVATSATPRAVPPPLPVQPSSAGVDEAPTSARPVPMSPTSPQSRPPPPPPPGQLLPRRTTNDSSIHVPPKDDSDEEVTEYDGDYDTDIASNAKHKAALKSHNRDSSEGALSDDAPASALSPQSRAIPPVPSAAPRDVPPPPPPSAAPRPQESFEAPRAIPPPLPPLQQPQAPPPPLRQSVDSPRTAPPIPPPQSSREGPDYDPYRSSTYQPALPGMIASLRRPTEEFDDDDDEQPELSHPNYAPPPPMERPVPPPPPTERAVPPPPPPPPSAAAPVYNEPEPTSMSGALSALKPSTELGRSNTTSRRSADVSRQTHDQGFIASDVDVGQNSMWWTQENNPPPVLQNRNDVLWEVESSTNQKRGGKTSVSRDVYVLYQDYSQTTINATFDASEPTHVSFEQSHERPPMQPRKDQLESASETYGAKIAKAAEKASGSTVGDGSAQEFVLSLMRPLNSALMPVGTRSYGALVYANLANASTQQFDEIRPGDIITFRNAKFAGHKGGLHQKYSQDVGNHVGVVIDWDGTKKKIRAWEQGNQEKGKKAKVRDESYRVADLKSGEVQVWRVMPRSYVNWGTT